MGSGFFIEPTDNVGLIINYYHEGIFVSRKLLDSFLILISYVGEHKIIIDNEIKVLTKADLEHSYFLGNVNDNKWRIRLVINAPIIGTKFIRLWDRGDFLIK